MTRIANAANIPLFDKAGTVPDVSGALRDLFQPMTFNQVTKTVSAFQVVETGDPINFQGVAMPFTDRQLMMRPEGERAWTFFELYADPVLMLEVDSVVVWKGKQTRIMSRRDYSLYGYVHYTLCQDWTGSGPK